MSGLVAPVGCDSGQLRGGLLYDQGLDVLASVVREHGAKLLPYTADDVGGELGCELWVYCQGGLVGGVGPVVSGDRMEVPAVPAQGQGGAPDQALSQRISVLAEQVVGLTEDDVQFAGVVVPDLQADHTCRAAGDPGRRVDGPAGDEPARPQFPAIRY